MISSESYAFAFFVFAILATFFFELFYVLELVYSTHEFHGLTSLFASKYIHYLTAIYILHNVLGSLLKIWQVDSSIRGVMLPQAGGKSTGNRYCTICECYCPPRSYHCEQCGVCILKRIHHCLFAKQCVGYKNFRYFYCLLLYVCIGSLYSSTLNMLIIWDLLGGFNLRNFFAHTFPFLFWVFGALSFQLMLTCMMSVVNIGGFLFTITLLFYHGGLLTRNQTVHEHNKGLKIYDLHSLRANLEESLGNRWYLIWISPYLYSQLPRNGIDFPTYAEYKLHSNKNK